MTCAARSTASRCGFARRPAGGGDRRPRNARTYGGRLVVGRAEQTSHAMLDNEIKEQRARHRAAGDLPGVAAFLLNVVVSRLMATQRRADRGAEGASATRTGASVGTLPGDGAGDRRTALVIGFSSATGSARCSPGCMPSSTFRRFEHRMSRRAGARQHRRSPSPPRGRHNPTRSSPPCGLRAGTRRWPPAPGHWTGASPSNGSASPARPGAAHDPCATWNAGRCAAGLGRRVASLGGDVARQLFRDAIEVDRRHLVPPRDAQRRRRWDWSVRQTTAAP